MVTIATETHYMYFYCIHVGVWMGVGLCGCLCGWVCFQWNGLCIPDNAKV